MISRSAKNKQLMLVLRTWSVPALLVIVACIHMTQWHSSQRSSWGTGAGFGMFATVDYHGSRFIRCIAETDQGRLRLDIPSSIKLESGLACRAIPSEKHMRILAADITKPAWFLAIDENGDQFACTESPGMNTHQSELKLKHLTLEIHGLKLNSTTRQMSSFPIRRMSINCSQSTTAGEQDVAKR